MKNTVNLEELAAFALRTTGEYCADTMLAHFAAQNPHATDEEINDTHALIEGFVEDAI